MDKVRHGRRLPIFQQLGIYDELVAIGKYLTHTTAYKESMQPYSPTDHSCLEELQFIVARPKLYDLLLKQVPPHKIHFGKRVLSVAEKDDKVTLQTADNIYYEGDIVVGADGAHSVVRQRMYEALKAKGTLPESDQGDLPFSCTCLVGQTKILDPEEFPLLKEPLCQFRSVLGDDKPFSWGAVTSAQNTLCWIFIHRLDKKTNKAALDERFRTSENSEWGPHAAQVMCDETRLFPIPVEDSKGTRLTLGDLYDRTPRDLVSKVMLEKVFDTWYSGRTVLLGDGAVTAIHDAVALANLIYAMPTTTSREITTIFGEYQAERHPAAAESYKNSQATSRVVEKGIEGAIFLFLLNHMPSWLWRIVIGKTVKHRPLVGFLASPAVKGTMPPVVSPSSEKAKAVFDKQKQAAAYI
ncbi:hypothetical protein BGX23_003110 [Mortierella sp. AD031]|nr:hypothetical protein BGX23_003110 [Mortierella sp. AD031]